MNDREQTQNTSRSDWINAKKEQLQGAFLAGSVDLSKLGKEFKILEQIERPDSLVVRQEILGILKRSRPEKTNSQTVEGRQPNTAAIILAAEEFAYAEKAKPDLWIDQRDQLNQQICAVVEAYLHGERNKDLANLWKLVPDKQSSPSLDAVLLRQKDAIQSNLDKVIIGANTHLERYRRGAAHLATERTRLVSLIGDVPELLSLLEKKSLEPVRTLFLASPIMQRLDKIIPHVPERFHDALNNLSASEQSFLYQEFENNPTDQSYWETVLTMPKISEIISFHLQLQLPFFYRKEHLVMLGDLLESVSVAQCLILLREKGQRIKTIFTDLQDIVGFFRIARSSKVSAEELDFIPIEKWKWLVLFLEVYGDEKVLDVWDGEHVRAFTYSRQTDPTLEQEFVSSLSPVLRAHVSASYRGYSEWPDCFESFKELLIMVPLELREDFFASLKPISSPIYNGLYRDKPQITKEEVANLQTWNALFPGPSDITFEQYVGIREYFQEPEWSLVQKGIDAYKQEGLWEQVVPTDTWFDILKLAGKDSCQLANQFYANNKAETRFLRKGHYDREIHAVNRNARSLHGVYTAIDFFTTYGSADLDLLLQFFDFRNGACEKVIAGIVDGSIAELDATSLDVGIVEGLLVELGHFLSDGRSELNPWYRPTLQHCLAFVGLNREQKLQFLSLRAGIKGASYNTSELIARVLAGQASISYELVTQLGLVSYSQEVLDAMAVRPDCSSLFKYIPTEHLSDEQRLQLVAKLIQFRDAGLPSAADYVEGRKQIFNHDYDKLFDRFIDCDVALIVRLANEAQACGVECGLTTILDFTQDNTEADWLRQIRSAGVMGGTYISHYLDLSPFLTDEEMDHHTQRIKDAESILGRETSIDERKVFVAIPDQLWPVINQRSQAIDFYLKHPSYAPAIDILSDGDFEHVSIQKYGVPVEILLEQKDAVFALGEELLKIPFENQKGINWAGLMLAKEKSPWLFTDDVLKTWQQPINVLVSCANLTVAEWPEFQAVLKSYTFTLRFASEVDTAIKLFRQGESLLSAEELKEVTDALGTKPSWDLASSIAGEKREGRTVKQIVLSATKADEESYGVRYEWENEHYVHEYNTLIARNPELSKVLTAPTTSYKSVREAPWLKRVNRLSDTALARIVRLEPFLHRKYSQSKSPLFYSAESVESVLFMVRHANFETIFQAIAVKGELSQLSDARIDHVALFCEEITPAMVVSYSELPTYFKIDLLDVPSFFLTSQCNQVIQGADRMHKLANGKESISAYDMLLMDLSTDLDSIEFVATHTYLPLNDDSLQGIEAMTGGERKELLQKARAVFSWTSNLDPNIVMKCLAQIPPDLRASVIKKKGVHHFGWPVLAYRSELISLGVSEDELDNLARNLYRNANNQVIPDLDFSSARSILLDHRANGDRTERFTRVFKAYKGEWGPLVEVLFKKDKKAVCDTVFGSWDRMPEGLQKHPALWQALILHEPALVLANFEKLPNECKGVLAQGDLGTTKFHGALVLAQDIFTQSGEAGTNALHEIYSKIEVESIRSQLVATLKANKIAVVELLLKVKQGYGDSVEMFSEFRLLAEAGKHALCESLLEAKEYYEQDLEKLGIARDYILDASIYVKETLERYAEIYKLEGRDAAREFVSALKKKARGLISERAPTELRADPDYMFMIKYVFPSGNYSSHENNLACNDHLDHVAGYTYDRAGVATEMSGLLGYKIKAGVNEDQPALSEYQDRLYCVKGFVASRGPDNIALQDAFTKKITDLYNSLVEEEQFKKLKELNLHEMVAALLLNEVVKKAKRKEYKPLAAVLDVLVEYKYAFCENLDQYIRRSADEALRLQDEVTRRVHLWRELSNIYGENIKHVARNEVFARLGSEDENRIIQAASELLASIAGDTAEISAKQRSNIERTFSNDHIPWDRKWDEKKQRDVPSKMDVLEKQMLDICTANIKFRNEEARAQCTQSVKDTVAQNQLDLTVEKFFEVVVPKVLSIRKLYLYDVYSKLEDILVLDINRIEAELAKYEEILEVEKKETSMNGPKEKAVTKSAKKRKIRHRITKTKETANARMGAYLCISGDKEMYNNPNYFEDIMQDEATGKCVGVNMFLNIEAEDGKKYLWMGPNPFEGFLGQVSSTQCYRAMYEYAAKFAEENGFEGIVVPPEDSQILGACTNRGGDFPELIKSSRLRDNTGALRIVEFGKKHTLGGSYGYSSGALIWHKSMIAKEPEVAAA